VIADVVAAYLAYFVANFGYWLGQYAMAESKESATERGRGA
jgi:hypothetical protein